MRYKMMVLGLISMFVLSNICVVAGESGTEPDSSICHIIEVADGKCEFLYYPLINYAYTVSKLRTMSGMEEDATASAYSAMLWQTAFSDGCEKDMIFEEIEKEGLKLYKQRSIEKLDVFVFEGKEQDYLGIICTENRVICLQYINDCSSAEWRTAQFGNPPLENYPYFHIEDYGKPSGVSPTVAQGFFSDGTLVLLYWVDSDGYLKEYSAENALNIMMFVEK